MSDPARKPPPGFDDLPKEEQIGYVQALWDRIAADPAAVSEPGWHRAVLDERAESRRAAPGEHSSWDEVRERVTRRLRGRPE
jgi:putative addiction module component (TIGR02574 family)